MLSLTRRYRFSAAHKLWNPNLSDEDNLRHFGACHNLHGHNYMLEVSVYGAPRPETGMIMDIVDLDQLIQSKILVFVDHKHLDADVDFLKGTLSTVENVARVFYSRLAKAMPQDVGLYRVRLYESDSNWAEITCNDEIAPV